jgi:hypothetical protein
VTRRDVVIVFPLCVIAGTGAAPAAGPLVTDVPVRVYETAGLDASLKAAALAVADRTLAAASVGVSWKQCPRASTAPPCEAPPVGELVVRIVHSTVEPRDRLPLGDAYVDTGARSGVLATVYFDRVARVAGAAGTDVRALLGYAIAHELGHLLLASSTHGHRGLMRPIWLAEELCRGRLADWNFTDREIAIIRSRLGQRAYRRPV